jgi:2',3'-cyclic-nucleotide 2'-phosphodiesterase/3'-nucleotidase
MRSNPGMKDFRHRLWRTVLCGLLFWNPARTACSREVAVTLLHTTDLHGHMLPVTDYEGHENVGGLLRCASKIAELRDAVPNLLLVDCGDTIQGSAESYLTGGRLTLRAMEWLGYDAWVIGNHEFDWGLRKLRPLHDTTSLTMLGANIRVREGEEHPLPLVRPFKMMEVDGIRVALVGLTTPGIPAWTLPDYLGGLLFESSLETLTRVMPLVRAENPDLMVLLAHQGYRSYGDDFANEIQAIARRFSEFDVILGGHTHTVRERADLGSVLYSQAGYHGIGVGRVDVVYDTVARRVTAKSAEFIRVGEETPLHPGLEALLSEDLETTRAYLDEQLGETEKTLSCGYRLPGQSPVQQLLCKAIQWRVKADVVLHGPLSDASLPPGPIGRRDLWEIVPYENRICVAQLTSEDLKAILAENLRYAGNRNFMGIYGLSYELHPDRKGADRIQHFRLPDGSPLHARRRLAVAFNSYVVASGGRRFPRLRRIVHRPAARLSVTDIDTRSAVEDYIREHSPLRIEAGREVTIIRK